ncbi:hypothetical protein C0993_000195, partial [Termitomyces sp. T159_Od127]
GQDATEAFYSLHRHEVLERPQYKRLQVGVISGEESKIHGRIPGEISTVPYAEPTWLAEGYHSAYFTEARLFECQRLASLLHFTSFQQNHRQFHKAIRQFFDTAREADGKRPSQSVIDKMAELNIHAMRMGPGKHLKGRTLMNGLVKPEQFDYFHEV